MKMDVVRATSVISSGLLLVAVIFLFFSTPYIGSAYITVTSKLGAALPLLTRDFSLALLGNRENPFSTFSERAVWAYCLWFILFSWPIALMIWPVRTPDFERSMATWCLCTIAYLSFAGTVVAIGIIGMLLPFTKL